MKKKKYCDTTFVAIFFCGKRFVECETGEIDGRSVANRRAGG